MDALPPLQSIISLDMYKSIFDTARAAERSTNAALALKRIKGLTPRTARQLAKATVMPVLDYASPICSSSLTEIKMRMLNQSQRIIAQSIVRAFRTLEWLEIGGKLFQDL